MTGQNTPPTLDVELAKMKKRVDALERELRDLQVIFKPEIVFSYAGPLAVGESPTWTRREAGRIIEVVARLRVAGTTATTILIKKNNVTVLTVNLPAGQLHVEITCSIFFAPDQDVLHDVISVVGTGATDLTVMHRFRR
jgi:hypothetical protein